MTCPQDGDNLGWSVDGAAAHTPSQLILRTTGHSDRREESLTTITSFSLNKPYPVFIERKYIPSTQHRYATSGIANSAQLGIL